MAIYESVNSVINDAAAEVGLTPVNDVFSTADLGFSQLRYLLDAAGRELVRMAVWAELVKEHTITTDASDGLAGLYPLPTDWAYMIPQTSWNRTDQLPLYGPLNAQDWQYLEGRNLGSASIYASFRIKNGSVAIFPNNPVPDAKSLKFEYVRNTWVSNAAEDTFYSRIQVADDLVLFPPTLAIKFLKVKFLEAKGFDSAKARDDFNEILDSLMGQDKSAPILNAAGTYQGVPYLNALTNVSDTGYGA